jgi:hypothetical protein
MKLHKRILTKDKEITMRKKMAAESPFSKLIQVGVVVKDLDKAIERLLSLGIGPFTPMLLPPDAEQWFRGKSGVGPNYFIKVSRREGPPKCQSCYHLAPSTSQLAH